MKCAEIMRMIEETYPKTAALSWDNVGLLIGDKEQQIGKIYLAVDADDDVVKEAADWGADLLITHHPLIFKPLSGVTRDHFIGRRVMAMIENRISYYAMHTNYDVIRMGYLAGEKMGLKEVEILEVTGEETQGIGICGVTGDKKSLGEMCSLVKGSFSLPQVKVFGDLARPAWKVAVCPGSGSSVIACALEKGADVLVTGDIGHHDGIDAVARGLAVIDGGHYGLEYGFMDDMKTFLSEKCPELEIRTAPVRWPFAVV